MEEKIEKRSGGNLDAGKSDRDRVIVRTSIIGVLANVFLAVFKAAVGFLSGSIAVILDAVNNLSDALSSVITIIGSKLSSKAPDKKHPLGYGRIEYMSALIVAAIVCYAGIQSGVESVKKIIDPVSAKYDTLSLLIIAVAILVKVVLGKYVVSQGEKVKSGSLVASGKDAMGDAVLSLSVLACALINKFTGVSLEAIVGAVISVIIIKSGIEMIRDTLNDIIGKRGDFALTNRIKKLISEEDGVGGAYDLVLYNYGPEKEYASVHIEVPDTMTAGEIDKLTRRIEFKVFKETGVILTGVGIYAVNTLDQEAADMRKKIYDEVKKLPFVVQLHGFFVDSEAKRMRFDVVLSFDVERNKGLKEVEETVRKLYPDYTFMIAADTDTSVTQ